MTTPLEQVDPQIAEVLRDELRRQHNQLEMIASENYTSRAVLEATGSVLTNKYAEGYPGKRYYNGCEVVDVAEDLARDRAKELFGAVYANVQPHSGSQANTAVYFTFLQPGVTVMGMDLSHGGHLTHGSPKNFSGMLYHFVAYGVNERTGRLDYEQAAKLAREHKPKMITVGASAYPRAIDYAKFREIADEVGAFLFADIAHPAGLIAAGLLPSPVPHAHVVTTTTHKTLRGPRGGLILMGRDFENPFGKTAAKSGRTLTMSELLDSMVIPGIQGGPLMHVIAAKAVGFREALQPAFKAYAQQVIVNAKALAEELVSRGLNLVSGGTDNHLILLELREHKLSGKQASDLLERLGITVNANLIPNDPRPPLQTSGIRMGSPALTTRGMGAEEFRRIGRIVAEALAAPDDKAVRKRLRGETQELADAFPVYADLQAQVEARSR
ncbi:MAG: serine hydroxymethyltransferase [Planctomycetota bacterium]|nr:serine hydroxymethyltransferase [Planctomycetota bacterium]